MKILITCFQGLVPILNKELKRLKYKPFDTFQTGTYIEGNWKDIYEINLKSRIANKVYAQLGNTEKKETFDSYFEYILDINFQEIIKTGSPISIKVATKGSILHSKKTIQSITQKAIITKLEGKNKHRNVNPNSESVDFFIKIENNQVEFFVNTSGTSLHNRGYRTRTGEAPLKETIAASLVHMGVRNFKKPLRDPCCGSGTICIEAAMIATNTAPGLQRKFAFQSFPNYKSDDFQKIKTDCEQSIFRGNYEILGTDIDPKMISIAKENAKKAGMQNYIKFETKDIFDQKTSNPHFFLITNPPYGKRMGNQKEIEKIHQKLASLYKNNNGAFISSFGFDNRKYGMKQKEVNNNGELCMVYSKIL